MEKRKVVGKVTPEERDEVQKIFERLNALKELFPTVDPHQNAALYERVLADMAETQKKFEDWWNARWEEYLWEFSQDGNWEIDFKTCEIYLN